VYGRSLLHALWFVCVRLKQHAGRGSGCIAPLPVQHNCGLLQLGVCLMADPLAVIATQVDDIGFSFSSCGCGWPTAPSTSPGGTVGVPAAVLCVP
jgi:hypothetical protein